MPRWKGKKVSRKRLHDLATNAESRYTRQSKYRINFNGNPTVVGGNKNSKQHTWYLPSRLE